MEGFKLIGIKLSRKSTNENGQSALDCGELWQQFEMNKIAAQIHDKLSDEVYAVYYEYESNEHGLFSYFIGCKVANETAIPEGLDSIDIPAQNYYIETAQGQMPNCVGEAWHKIWQTKINRQYGFDFEVYGEKCQDWNDAEVDIFISLKEEE